MTFQAARSLVPDDSQAMLSAILESATDYAIITTDLDQVITTWNAGARNIMGWEEAEIVGQHVSVIFTPEDRANRCPDAEMEKALEEGRAVDERWHSRKDGSRFWATGLMMPLKTADGVAIGCLKILRDQTEERLASETARVDAEFMRQLLESSNDCIKVLDLEGRLQFMSAGGQRIMEVDDFSKFLDCPWPEFWHDELNQAAREAVATPATGGSARFRGQTATAKGTLRWWDVQVTPINGADGRPERLLSISRDITDAHLAEEASRERETYLRLLLDSAWRGSTRSTAMGRRPCATRPSSPCLGSASRRTPSAASSTMSSITRIPTGLPTHDASAPSIGRPKPASPRGSRTSCSSGSRRNELPGRLHGSPDLARGHPPRGRLHVQRYHRAKTGHRGVDKAGASRGRTSPPALSAGAGLHGGPTGTRARL